MRRIASQGRYAGKPLPAVATVPGLRPHREYRLMPREISEGLKRTARSRPRTGATRDCICLPDGGCVCTRCRIFDEVGHETQPSQSDRIVSQ